MSATGPWEHVVSHIVMNCPEYHWLLEEYRDPHGRQMLFAHIRVFKFTPALLKRMRETYATFRKCVIAPLYTLGEVDDDKFEKFVALFGFKYLTDVVCVNGEKRRLFISLGNQEQEHGQPVPVLERRLADEQQLQ